jgi:hemolysin III
MVIIMFKIKIPRYSLGEELINSISHGIGAGLSIAGLILLIIRSVNHNNSYALIASLVYGISLILLYTISCIYHGLSPNLKAKKVLRVIDHCNVFLLEASTFTPICLVLFNSSTGWILFSLIWVVTITGIILNFINVDKYQLASVFCHLLAGWSILFLLNTLSESIGKTGIIFLIAGGALYSDSVLSKKRIDQPANK